MTVERDARLADIKSREITTFLRVRRSKHSLRIVATGIILALSAPVSGKEPLHGTATVVDGDTLDLGPARIRLFGIDAPELAQTCAGAGATRRSWPCGLEAKERLAKLVSGREVTCTQEGVDRYGRILGTCSVEGKSVNETLVEEGLAWAFVRYSTTYVAAERRARTAAHGIFSAENVTAWDFRAHRWEGATAAPDEGRRAECPIKGNISSSGRRIYHMPWDRYYAATKIDIKAGERWFCDEGEAESRMAAGE